MSVSLNGKLVYVGPTLGDLQYQANALKTNISSLPDGDEKTYYELALKLDETGISIATDPANASLTPEELDEKIVQATQALRQEMHALQAGDPNGWKWSLPTSSTYGSTPVS